MSDSIFRSVVVGLDGKGLAQHAAERAFDIARRFDSHLHFVHALEVYWPVMKAEEMAQAEAAALAHAHKESARVLQAACNRANADFHDAEEQLRVVPGPPAKVLLDASERHQADLLVVGPHGKRSMLDFGSTSRAVLSRSHAPVWTQTGAVEKLNTIVVATDFSTHNQRAVELARTLAQRFGAALEVVHCYSPPAFAFAGAAEGTPSPTYAIDAERDAAREQLERATSGTVWKDVEVRTSFLEGDPVEELGHRAETADLVVLGTHGRTGLSRFLLGSVAYGVLKRTEQAVLVVPSHEQEWLLDAPRS
jgi:nucleotide-binding universal stress UspA family protein